EVMRRDDPYLIAAYVQSSNNVQDPNWRWAHHMTKNKKKLQRIERLSMDARKTYGRKFKYGVEVPRSIKQALLLDTKNGNSLWQEAIDKEKRQVIDEFETFKVLDRGEVAPQGYDFVPMHWVFDVKVDGTHKARLVAGGNWTAPIEEDIYSGVVSNDAIRLAFVAASLMRLDVIAADVGNAYLNALTKEKLFTVAGKEFGEFAGCVMIFVKALYGLKTSAARWHEHMSDTLRDMGFTQSKADTNLWYRVFGNTYDYVAVYVDDLLVLGKHPMNVIDILRKKYVLKGVGPPKYHLGGDIGMEKGKYYLGAKTYIRNVCKKIEALLEIRLGSFTSPMADGDHPEIDDSDLLDENDVSIYRMLIGSAQWAVTLGRWDILYAVSTMARFNAIPRKGHKERMLRIFGYLKCHLKGRVLVDIEMPDLSGLKLLDNCWSTLYPGAVEEIPDGMPEPRTGPVMLTCYVDADHAHDLETRRSVTGVLISVNKTPIKWFSKRQNTVESSTYGSELVAARIATDLIIEMRYKLRMIGVNVVGPTIMMADNQSVVQNMTLPSSTLKKKHNAVAYHRVREA
ncbi:MAG: reverse transcriptase domain-containing protein, partial [bacterium]